MSIIFEVEDLLEASPATVSRCGMVYLENNDRKWNDFLNAWFNNLPQTLSSSYHIAFLKEIIENLFSEVLKLIFSPEIKLVFKVSPLWIALNFLKLFECFLLKNKTKSEINMEVEIEKEKAQAKLAAQKLEGH